MKIAWRVGWLYAYRCFDVRMRVIINQFEILVLEIKDAFHIRVDFHPRQLARLARQLQSCLLKVVEIEMRVAGRIDKVARLQVTHLCHHHGQQRIGGDIKWYAQEGVGTALIQLTR